MSSGINSTRVIQWENLLHKPWWNEWELNKITAMVLPSSLFNGVCQTALPRRLWILLYLGIFHLSHSTGVLSHTLALLHHSHSLNAASIGSCSTRHAYHHCYLPQCASSAASQIRIRQPLLKFLKDSLPEHSDCLCTPKTGGRLS